MKRKLATILVCLMLILTGCGNKVESVKQSNSTNDSKNILDNTKSNVDDSYNGEQPNDVEQPNDIEQPSNEKEKSSEEGIFKGDFDSSKYEVSTITLSFNDEDILKFTNPSVFSYISVEKDGVDIVNFTEDTKADRIYLNGPIGSSWRLKIFNNGFDENTKYIESYENGYNAEHNLYNYISTEKVDDRECRLRLFVDSTGVCNASYEINIDGTNYIENSLTTLLTISAEDMTDKDAELVLEYIMSYIEFV